MIQPDLGQQSLKARPTGDGLARRSAALLGGGHAILVELSGAALPTNSAPAAK